MQVTLSKGELPAAIFQSDRENARTWWAALEEGQREDRICDLTQVLEFYGIDLPESEDGWMMACWESECA